MLLFLLSRVHDLFLENFLYKNNIVPKSPQCQLQKKEILFRKKYARIGLNTLLFPPSSISCPRPPHSSLLLPPNSVCCTQQGGWKRSRGVRGHSNMMDYSTIQSGKPKYTKQVSLQCFAASISTTINGKKKVNIYNLTEYFSILYLLAILNLLSSFHFFKLSIVSSYCIYCTPDLV